jgi:hypothetical protein
VHGATTWRGHVRLSIAKDGAFDADLVSRVANTPNTLDAIGVTRQDAAHLIRVALASMRDQLLTERLRKRQRS